MKALGIDYGEKRIGLAYGDELGLAMPIDAAVEATRKERLAHIERVVSERGVTDLVVGYPLNMDGSAGFKAQEVDAFVAELERRFELPIHRVDERLTTHQAKTDLGTTRCSKGRRREIRKSGEIDSRAAALILQDFLDQQNVLRPEFPDAGESQQPS